MSNSFNILPVGPFNSSFSYLCDEELHVGDIVKVPFGRQSLIGLVTDEDVVTDRELKTVSKIFNFNIGKINCEFLNWVSTYTMIPRGNVLRMMLAERTIFNNVNVRDAIIENENIHENINENFSGNILAGFREIELNPSQLEAYEKIIQNGVKPFLLKGVTGSGKTEIYLSVVRNILQQGKQALILFPEIALTQQLMKRIEKYFGFRPIIWNSNVSAKNRRIAWQKAISGESCIIIGARSALFLPFQNLGIIVVDEEHDPSYKQEERDFYNARDMSVVRGHLHEIPVILSSATPSLESYMNAKNGKYGYISIENRFGSAQMPSINLIDMRQNKFRGFLSPVLLKEISATISRKEQCLIYLNRRGYSPVILCKACGEKVACPNCSTWMVYHKHINKLICHYCDHRINIPQKCHNCACEDSYIPFGPGVEKIFEELCERIPEARIEIASSDTIASDKNIEKLFDKITNKEVDIVVGTQILAKGHHFPDITLVGIVDGDLGLSGADLRASERTYQLVNQVAGRAGRAEKAGKIFIQTFSPEHPLYVALKSGTVEDFINLEVESRKKGDLPPFSRLISIIISGTNKELTQKIAQNLGKTCPRSLEVYGPAPAPIFLLRGRTRWRFLLKLLKKKSPNDIIKSWLDTQKIPKNIKIQIDIDPMSFL